MCRSRSVFFLLALPLAFASSCIIVGCAQNTEATSPQRSDQAQVTPTTTAQDLMTAGSDVKVFIINAPGHEDLPDEYSGSEGDIIESSNGQTATTGKMKAGYAQAGFTINITTGGTTPSATGHATGTATSSQTPANNQDIKSDLRPETSLSANAGFGMPGSALSQQATAAGSGGTVSDTAQTATQTPTYTQLIGQIDQMAKMIEVFRQALEANGMIAKKEPTTQPE